jgi:hypothetical protein
MKRPSLLARLARLQDDRRARLAAQGRAVLEGVKARRDAGLITRGTVRPEMRELLPRLDPVSICLLASGDAVASDFSPTLRADVVRVFGVAS